MARLGGAALKAKILKQIREELARDYGLPMDLYTHKWSEDYSIGPDTQPILEVTFTHRETNATVRVTEIHPDDDGSILVYGSNYGHLAY
jgi:hypothetical protein